MVGAAGDEEGRWLLMDTRFLFYNKSILECGDSSTACRYTKKKSLN